MQLLLWMCDVFDVSMKKVLILSLVF